MIFSFIIHEAIRIIMPSSSRREMNLGPHLFFVQMFLTGKTGISIYFLKSILILVGIFRLNRDCFALVSGHIKECPVFWLTSRQIYRELINNFSIKKYPGFF